MQPCTRHTPRLPQPTPSLDASAPSGQSWEHCNLNTNECCAAGLGGWLTHSPPCLQMQQEEIAQGTARVLESMQRKGQQIRQLQAYCCALG